MDLTPPQIPNPHSLQGGNHSDLVRATGVLAETHPRTAAMANTGGLVTATLSLQLIGIPAGTVVSNISFLSATTAASVPVNQWFALYDSSRNRLAVTSDDLTTAWTAASTTALKTLPVSRSVTDAVATSGSAVITSATAAFTASDVGKAITFAGAGAAGAGLGSSAVPVTIASVQSATSVTLSTTAGTSVASGGTLYVATAYTVTTTAVYYIGIMTKASTVPTLQGTGLSGTATRSTQPPILCGTADAGLAAATTAPNPAASLAAVNAYYLAYIT